MEEATEKSSRVTYFFGPFHLDPAERRLIRDGHDLRLPPKVFETLVLLVERHGLLVKKDELMTRLWPGIFVEEVTLAGNISLLRKALGDEPGQDQSKYIETVSKRGYRFIADVREVYPPTVQSGGQHEVESESVAIPVPRRWQKRWAWIALSGLALLLAGATALWRFKVARPFTGQFHSLAVLPLENLSGDPDQEYFADGMTDELITNLAQIHSLRVISRTSVMQFKHTKKTLPEIAAQLNVDAIVSGSVSRKGNDVHITAQLLNARQDRHLWAGSYERQINDVSGLQSQITRAIADEVKASITPQEDAHLTKIRPRNPEAYDALLRGRFLRARRMANTFQALPFFKQAVAIDPNNAEAWEALADSYAHLGADLGQDPATMRPLANAALAKALELDPDLAEAHATAGWVKLWYDWDWAGAEREFRRAIELSPNDSVAHRYYSHYLDFRGRFDEAINENGHAMDLAPLDMLPQAHLAWIYKDAHMADKTIEQSKHLLEIDPNFVNGYFYLGAGYELKHQWSEANAVYEQVREKTNKGAYLLSMARLWALAGNRPRAEATWAELLKGAADAKVHIPPYTYAEFLGALGDRDKAFEQLEKAYQGHEAAMINLKVNPYFDNLRSDPRFQDLERRVGF